MLKFSLNDAIGYDPWTKARIAATIPTEVWRTPISFLQFILFNWIYFIKVLRIHNLIFNSAIIFYFDILSKYFKYKFELIFLAKCIILILNFFQFFKFIVLSSICDEFYRNTRLFCQFFFVGKLEFSPRILFFEDGILGKGRKFLLSEKNIWQKYRVLR